MAIIDIAKWRANARSIRDHQHFERILMDAEPEERHDLYESVAPELRFKAKPIDAYFAAAKGRAEREQLPVIMSDGKLRAFSPARDVSSLHKHAEDVIAASLAKRTLTLVCAKCTKEAQFFGMEGETPVAIVMKARRAGWVYDYLASVPCEICPDCPTSLRVQ